VSLVPKIMERLENWIQNGSIRSQTGRVFNLFALLVILLGGISMAGTMRIEQRSSDLAELTRVAFLTNTMTNDVTEAKNMMGAYHSRGRNPEVIQNALTRAKAAQLQAKNLSASLASLESKQLGAMKALNADLQEFVRILNEVREAPDSVIDTEAFLGAKYDHIDATVERINGIGNAVASQVEEKSGKGLNEIKILIASLTACLLLALGLVIAGRRIISRRVIAPIGEISEASERIALGETELELPGADRADEIGTLAAALNVLRNVQQEAAEQALFEHEREMERQAQLQTEREEQQRKQAEMMRSLAESLEATVGDVATEVAAASNQMHTVAAELSRHVGTSAATINEANENLKRASDGIVSAAAASDEFALSINEVSRQATSSSERARKAAEATSKADETVTGLTSSADRISQIIEVIAGIAQRTNLLALNASIEAARGGEAGRGFAVVASEVKELAVQTGRATEEVEALIREMQEATGQSASALNLISKEVIALETTAIAIASAVDQQAVAGQDLAQSIDLVAQNTKTVSSTFDDVSRVAKVSGTTASEVQQSSASLSELATRLRQQVSEFVNEVRAA
jgi:methyl-accepting chemotaxis protein